MSNTFTGLFLFEYLYSDSKELGRIIEKRSLVLLEAPWRLPATQQAIRCREHLKVERLRVWWLDILNQDSMLAAIILNDALALLVVASLQRIHQRVMHEGE